MNDKHSSIFNYSVGELIEELKKYPEDMPVIVSGYETGYENFYLPIVRKIRHIPENIYWDGEFQIDENGMDALILEREERHD